MKLIAVRYVSGKGISMAYVLRYAMEGFPWVQMHANEMISYQTFITVYWFCTEVISSKKVTAKEISD